VSKKAAAINQNGPPRCGPGPLRRAHRVAVRGPAGRRHRHHRQRGHRRLRHLAQPEPARRQRAAGARRIGPRGLIDHALPDVLGAGRDAHAGRHTIVVGSGHSAANTLLDLARLADTAPGTRITWAVRGGSAQRAFGGEHADELPVRGALGSGLRSLVDTGKVALVEGFGVHTVRRGATSRSARSSPPSRAIWRPLTDRPRPGDCAADRRRYRRARRTAQRCRTDQPHPRRWRRLLRLSWDAAAGRANRTSAFPAARVIVVESVPGSRRRAPLVVVREPRTAPRIASRRLRR
jgi:hypothetical protein